MLFAATLQAQDTLLVQTERRPVVFFTPDALEQTIDLTQFFQKYPAPGPVATFTAEMPIQAGLRALEFFGGEAELMTFQTVDGVDQNYASVLDIDASDFVRRTETIEFQLFPADAPETVANFITNAKDGAYTETIIHRNTLPFNVPEIILQAGSYQVYEPDSADTGDQALFATPALFTVPLEYQRPNIDGSLALARGQGINSGSTGFFINMVDNSDSFGESNGFPEYAVFGQVAEADRALLTELAEVTVWPAKKVWPARPSATGVVDVHTQNLRRIFLELPLYAFTRGPDMAMDKGAFVTFSDITISEGSSEGLTYRYAIIESITVDDGDGGEEVIELQTDRDSFQINVGEGQQDAFATTGQLYITAVDTGSLTVDVTARDEALNTEVTTRIVFNSLNPELIAFFEQYSKVRPSGWYETWYGWVQDVGLDNGESAGMRDGDDGFAWFLHQEHHYQLADTSTREQFSRNLHVYDQNLNSWLMLNRPIHPNLYVYKVDSWVYYQEGTAVEWDEATQTWVDNRWFFVHATDGGEGQWLQGKDL